MPIQEPEVSSLGCFPASHEVFRWSLGPLRSDSSRVQEASPGLASHRRVACAHPSHPRRGGAGDGVAT